MIDDETRWAIRRAGELYDKQWVFVVLCEPLFYGYAAESLQKKYARCARYELDDLTTGTKLRIETDPKAVRDRIEAYIRTSQHNSRSFMPEFLADPESEDVISIDDSVSLREYTLIEGNFIWSIDDRIVTIPYDRWESICHDYAAMGGDLTSSEVARKHGISTPVLKRILSLYGQYKASPPVCRESILDQQGDLEPLVAAVVESREAAFMDKLQAKQDQTWKADYKRLLSERVLEDRLVENATKMLENRRRPVFGRPPKKSHQDIEWVAHVPTADEHLGKYNWSSESFGADYDTDIGCDRLRVHADRTVQWIVDQGGRCTTVYRTLLGDLFHALTGETAHGTRLDQDTRGARVWAMGFDAIEYGIGRMLTVADHVHLLGSKGNHDDFAFWQFMHLLQVAYRDEERVTVTAQPGYYAAFRVGESLHVLDHGYRVGAVGGWKTKAQAEVTAREIGGEDFHGAKHLYTYIGHKHELEVSSLGRHHRIMRLESLGESDDYETSLRFPGDPVAHLFRLDSAGRLASDTLLFPEDLESPAVLT